MNKPEYFYELACCNCPEKDRCLEQKEKKESLINALFSYIENENNKITIGQIKNQIPTLTRCDVVLEKQLQRLKEGKEQYKQALEEIRDIAELEVVIFDNKPLFPTNIQRIIDKINEVLKDV